MTRLGRLFIFFCAPRQHTVFTGGRERSVTYAAGCQAMQWPDGGPQLGMRTHDAGQMLPARMHRPRVACLRFREPSPEHLARGSSTTRSPSPVLCGDHTDAKQGRALVSPMLCSPRPERKPPDNLSMQHAFWAQVMNCQPTRRPGKAMTLLLECSSPRELEP